MKENIEDFSVIVDENGSIDFFEKKSIAELALEPVDIKNEEYLVHDFKGRPCALSIFRGSNGIEFVKINLDEKKEAKPEELRKSILNFFQATGFYKEKHSEYCLSDLIEEAVKKFGYTQ